MIEGCGKVSITRLADRNASKCSNTAYTSVSNTFLADKRRWNCAILYNRINHSQLVWFLRRNYMGKLIKINGKISKLQKLIVKGTNLTNKKKQDLYTSQKKDNKLVLTCKWWPTYNLLIWFNLIIESDTALLISLRTENSLTQQQPTHITQ